ncbi:MAG: hypothetical protein ABIQ38_09645 [Ilumatobacteraceae bacterium]
MSGVTVAFAIVAIVSVFMIASVVIGREAHRLDALAPRAIYRLEEAVSFVAERLPPESQSRLTLDELKKLLALHMDWMSANGLQPNNVVDRQQDITATVVVGEETLTAYLLGEAEKAHIDVLDDVDVVYVVRAHLDYFDAIGAVGPSASSNDL